MFKCCFSRFLKGLVGGSWRCLNDENQASCVMYLSCLPVKGVLSFTCDGYVQFLGIGFCGILRNEHALCALYVSRHAEAHGYVSHENNLDSIFNRWYNNMVRFHFTQSYTAILLEWARVPTDWIEYLFCVGVFSRFLTLITNKSVVKVKNSFEVVLIGFSLGRLLAHRISGLFFCMWPYCLCTICKCIFHYAIPTKQQQGKSYVSGFCKSRKADPFLFFSISETIWVTVIH